MKNLLLISLALALLASAAVIAAIYLMPATPKPVPAPLVVVEPEPPPPLPEPVAQAGEPAPPPQIETPAPQIPDPAVPAQKPRKKTPDQDPMARVALSFVGTDPDADALWMDAINNSKLPAKERKNLIEDLNEDGLSNRKHPQIIDVPLITSRLQLIERLRPDAMDETNAKAFDEAHKDLAKMYLKLTGSAWGE